ncbi:hypothetical protein G4B88_026162 [Cannabis sativa]|uniref:F-box domain-containing protein n=1 Tax=Cannabis sativa TaxID=3483 RepID=A0A7J6HA60_CANSA|nr:hypothetical protein G4B88_026162 [Cannabis sativa]
MSVNNLRNISKKNAGCVVVVDQFIQSMGIESQRQGVLDLCASPSGWTQIATRRVPRGSLVVKTSLNPNASRRSKRVMRKYECSAFDLVLHYGAPNMGGAWAMEATVQNALVIDVVKLSTHLLAPKDYNSIKYCLLKLFERVVVHKPISSRSVSAEIFVLAFNYKAPAKIDPRILDVRHLFQGGIEPQKKKVLHDLGRVAKKRHNGDTTLRKVSIAIEFIWSKTPLHILGSVTSISFHDPTSLLINHHALTTQEKFTLVEWRIHIRKALIGSEKTEVANVKNEEKEDEDDRVVREMEELTHVLECKKKRVKKLHAKRQAKEKLRKEMAMQMDGVDDSYVDRELFSLSTTKFKFVNKFCYSQILTFIKHPTFVSKHIGMTKNQSSVSLLFSRPFLHVDDNIEMPKLTNLSILPNFKIVVNEFTHQISRDVLEVIFSKLTVKSRIVAAAVSRVWRKTILSLGLEDGMWLMRDEYLRCKAIWNDSLRERFTINFDLSEL